MSTTADALDRVDTPAWTAMAADEVERLLAVDRGRGLDHAEAERRRHEAGPNELRDSGGRSALRLLWDQVRAVMVLILVAAAALSLALGKALEAGAVAAIVVLFVTLGFVQEQRAERAIAALRRMSAPAVRVRRDGADTTVAAPELVPGDIVVLEAGNVVPADLRLVESASVRVQEAALTGESEPVDKIVDPIDGDLALGDRRNQLFSGTQVVYGRGVGIVTATGMDTELGRIATLLSGVEDNPTPLQRRLDRVGKQLAVLGVVVAGLVVAMGAAAGEPLEDLLLTAIGVAVAVIPEGLPAVVTVTLAIGAQRMLRRHALVRRLSAVETLGSVTVICSDKTGTLTQNRMTVTVVDVLGDEVPLAVDGWPAATPATVRATLAAAALCNDAELGADGADALGDPTETALLVAAGGVGLSVPALREAAPRISEVPFDSERKRMATIHHPVPAATVPELAALAPGGQALIVVKGALDGLLPLLVGVHDGARVVALDAELRARIERAGDRHAAAGQRVLGVAYRSTPVSGASAPTEGVERELVLLGLVAMVDPPRTEVAAAVARCQAAGIRAVMITGDHPLTARAIATQLGIGDDGATALTGSQLERMDDAELRCAARDVSVFARVSPEHKLRIVAALKADGQVVAMTGDGVNDAPALRRADIGIAMGITGTDVSKEAAAMVLRDDNFSTIVAAVEEGRVIYDNLRRFVSFAVAGNLGKILVMLGWPIPLLLTDSSTAAVALLPLQLLWLNLMTDGLLGLAMGVEGAEPDVMQRPPNDPESGILSGETGRQTALVGVLIGALALAVGFTYSALDRPEWQTMVFATVAFLQVGQALATRSSTRPIWRLGLRTNPTMAGVVAAVIVLQLLALYTPLNGLLDVAALGAGDLAVCLAAPVVLVAVIEAGKARRRRVA